MTKAFRLIASTGIHKGDREYQQDQVTLIAHERHNGCVLGVIADGMGGRSGGRKASDQVMMTARQLFERYSPDTDDPVAMLKSMVEEAHIVIRLTAISAEQEPHSTIAAFLINPRGDCHWAHAGDSRIYHFHGARMVFRTSDHSYVQALVDRGELTEAEANNHPHSNILVGCLGTERSARHDPCDSPAAAGRCADGLQRRRVALLLAHRAGFRGGLAFAARSHGVPD
jgi:serine/threonine protein phosphatase PrpC